MKRGNVGVDHRDRNHGTGPLDAEDLPLFDRTGSPRHKACRSTERRLDKDRCRVTRCVGLIVGDQRRLLQVECPAGNSVPSAHPTGHFAVARPTGNICDVSADQPLAPIDRFEGAVDRNITRGRVAALRFDRHVLPLAIHKLADYAIRRDFKFMTGDRIPVDVGHDRLNVEGITRLHERASRSKTDVEVGRMHEQIGAVGPYLTVDIGDTRLGRHRGG